MIGIWWWWLMMGSTKMIGIWWWWLMMGSTKMIGIWWLMMGSMVEAVRMIVRCLIKAIHFIFLPVLASVRFLVWTVVATTTATVRPPSARQNPGASSQWHAKRNLATSFQEILRGNSYLGLRIPETGRRAHQEIDVVILTKRDLYVLEVVDLPGVITIDNDEHWSQKNDDGTVRFHPNIVANLKEKMIALSSYMERRGLKIPDYMLKTRVVFINPGCSPAQDILLQPEVISCKKWQHLTRKQENGFLGDCNDAFSDSIHKQLHSILSTAPSWDRVELNEGDVTFLGEFISFKGEKNDMENLRGIKRSKISQLKPHTSLWDRVGLSEGLGKLKLECTMRDYRGESLGQQAEVTETRINENMKIVFQVLGVRKHQCFMLKDVTLLHFHA